MDDPASSGSGSNVKYSFVVSLGDILIIIVLLYWMWHEFHYGIKVEK